MKPNLIQAILYGSLILGLFGCTAGSTKVRITGVSRDKVAQILWEVGGKVKADNRQQGGKDILIWPSAEAINKRRAVIKYYQDHGAKDAFNYSTPARDTVGILEKEPDCIVVSLRCEETDFEFPDLFTMLFTSQYHRKEGKERQILAQMVERLKGENVSVRWLDDNRK